ncbi:MAG: hypothetical protein ACXWP4_14370 [Polyangiales bacterium]
MRLAPIVMLAVLAVSGSAGAQRVTEKRAVPDYGGTEKQSCAICWPARVVLFPLRVVSEVVLRQPIGLLVRAIERDASSSSVPSVRPDLAPVFAIDPGFVARFGLTGTVREGNVRVPMIAEGGVGAYTFAIAPTFVTQQFVNVGGFATAARRPDAIYASTGARVALDRGEAGFRAWGRLSRFIAVTASFGGRGVHVKPEPPNDPAREDYVATFERIEIAFDTTHEKHPREKERPRSIRTDGLRIALASEHAGTFTENRQWLTYGGTILGSVDTGLARILELSAMIRLVDPIAPGGLPWTEQIPLGGDVLRGHLEGRVRGRSVMVYAAQWRWPVWTFLEGFLLGEVGNAFDEHLKGAAPKTMRLSAVAGMRHESLSGYLFELMGGIGTDTIEEKAHVSSGRFFLGASRRF